MNKQKGQIFSTDFLIAMIIIILIIGVIISAIELRNFEHKEKISKNIMEQKTNLAFNTLITNKEINCNINELQLINTIDLNKLQNKKNLKEMIGLDEYEIQIKIGSQTIGQLTNNDINNKLVIKTKIMSCENSSNLSGIDLNNCRTEGKNCFSEYLSENEIEFVVAK
ncbi:MAG: hypothetical protein GX950_01240 [Candidatus Diapherotrites archaeon]|uniref:Uncharacterized protein n=1 Tax=Candidatus Iainarchaeum sp. TaxID=3101447 RepID=A0A7K4BZ50_9ARCH|nr:hypothetical protein [Candidatus Diapherotrites archaeon]